MKRRSVPCRLGRRADRYLSGCPPTLRVASAGRRCSGGLKQRRSESRRGLGIATAGLRERDPSGIDEALLALDVLAGLGVRLRRAFPAGFHQRQLLQRDDVFCLGLREIGRGVRFGRRDRGGRLGGWLDGAALRSFRPGAPAAGALRGRGRRVARCRGVGRFQMGHFRLPRGTRCRLMLRARCRLMVRPRCRLMVCAGCRLMVRACCRLMVCARCRLICARCATLEFVEAPLRQGGCDGRG